MQTTYKYTGKNRYTQHKFSFSLFENSHLTPIQFKSTYIIYVHVHVKVNSNETWLVGLSYSTGKVAIYHESPNRIAVTYSQ